MPSRANRVGLWINGASGGVASTVALGVAALGRGLTTTTGLVSELPDFRHLGLTLPGEIVIGGHEIRRESPLSTVRELHKKAGLFDEEVIAACAPDLAAVHRRIVPGTLIGSSSPVKNLAQRGGLVADRTAGAAVERLARDIDRFRDRNKLDTVIMMHLASVEPVVGVKILNMSSSGLTAALRQRSGGGLPSSAVYALAAIKSGCAHINFTPSVGMSIKAIRQRAMEAGLPFMGCDGKTGETLVKSVLAPMFAMRNLSVLSWVGQNILGNRDGAVLQDPSTRRAKIRSKDSTLAGIIGSKATTHVSIDYVPSLHDWKVAWDYIHFEGFLGTRMSLQFTWQGSDSALAAPLVIDLTRLAALACDSGEAGPMKHLACFFKDPIDVKERDAFSQWRRLMEYVASHTAAVATKSSKRPTSRRK